MLYHRDACISTLLLSLELRSADNNLTRTRQSNIRCRVTMKTLCVLSVTVCARVRKLAKAVDTNAAAGEFFIEADYATFADDALLAQCGLVTHEEFANYFGLFASRLFLLMRVDVRTTEE